MILGLDLICTYSKSGSRTYIENFLNQILNKNTKKMIIFISKDFFKKKYYQNKKIKFIIKPSLFSIGIFRLIWTQFLLPVELKLYKIDKLFCPLNICPLILKFSKIKTVLVLHSNLPWFYFKEMPGNFIKKILIKKIMEYSIKFCDTLIVNSYSAKREIKKILSIKKKINVVYLGSNHIKNSKNNFKKIKNFNYKNNYFLSIVSCARYHNILNILKAYKQILLQENDLKYVLIMQILDKNYYKEILKFIKKNFKKDQVTILKNLSPGEIKGLHLHANFYIFSSYCEVFGLTTLEAMSLKNPVLVSDKSALKEINGDSALYFDPDNIGNIVFSFEKIIRNLKLKNILIKKGLKNINGKRLITKLLKF